MGLVVAAVIACGLCVTGFPANQERRGLPRHFCVTILETLKGIGMEGYEFGAGLLYVFRELPPLGVAWLIGLIALACYRYKDKILDAALSGFSAAFAIVFVSIAFAILGLIEGIVWRLFS